MSNYSRDIPPLGEDEAGEILESLERDAMLRKSFRPDSPLFIYVDDRERGSLDPSRQRKVQVEVDDGNKWFKVYARSGGQHLLLATYLYRHGDVLQSSRKRSASTLLEGGQLVKFTAYPEAEGEGRTIIKISYHESAILRALQHHFRLLRSDVSRALQVILGGLGPGMTLMTKRLTWRVAYPLALVGLLAGIWLLVSRSSYWQPITITIVTPSLQQEYPATQSQVGLEDHILTQSPQPGPVLPTDENHRPSGQTRLAGSRTKRASKHGSRSTRVTTIRPEAPAPHDVAMRSNPPALATSTVEHSDPSLFYSAIYPEFSREVYIPEP